ncbi:MAG: Pyridoxamine 5'-phosphate oxidase-related, FMN-binding [uncultured Solirubrobacteraceae bacterium]|uniref:Pyridoxamine 5'-phosphate oxidase-related, FMN-binding n=1 Tax=uncultured Solirubrobacteraceae bacterium TaxID=1162706 RepID=A0A6J4SP45_9ACTN|nr:MAG: Pyridoxamine 5'-phosphate oxidase-related, FMN-binding [uncultured Solirubrobacteraceae bacterium]
MATAPSQRARVRRAPARADYERATIDAILDEGLVAHLGFEVDGQPYVIPTLHARVGDTVYIHGSSASRMIRTLTACAPACLTVTLIDAMVLARSAFHHSMNYRSVVVLGQARAVADPDELLVALQAFTDKLVPGRWDEVRRPSSKELKATRALAMTLDEASAKARTGPPVDDEEDYALDVWAGVIPLGLAAGAPVADPKLAAGIEPSEVVTRWRPGGR